jgi:hypothetical protein
MDSTQIQYNIIDNQTEIKNFQSGGDLNLSCYFIDE